MKQKIAALAAGSVLAAAAAFVATHEGYVPKTYLDPVGIPTACFGHTGSDVTPGRRFTEAECRALLDIDLATAQAAVAACITAPLTDGQQVALTSFAFNVGKTALCRSQLARKANAGEPDFIWCAELDRWVYAKGRKLPGLVRRRREERALCDGSGEL